MGESVRDKNCLLTFIGDERFPVIKNEEAGVVFCQIHFNTELPSIYFHISTAFQKKNIYLCRTLSAHQRDGTGRKRFLFPIWSKSVLSLDFEIANSNRGR